MLEDRENPENPDKSDGPYQYEDGEILEDLGTFTMSQEVAALLGPPWAEQQRQELN